MSVMNRKMFSNRDARTKLAGMGGILASSPELMGAAQRFETLCFILRTTELLLTEKAT